jgi:hypothetical protein
MPSLAQVGAEIDPNYRPRDNGASMQSCAKMTSLPHIGRGTLAGAIGGLMGPKASVRHPAAATRKTCLNFPAILTDNYATIWVAGRAHC